MQLCVVDQVLNTTIPTSPVVNSPYSIMRRSGGLLLSKVITLSALGVPQSLNCFQLTGTVVLKKLFGFVTTATSFATCTAAQFDLYDSAAAVPLTKNDGVLSAMPVGTFFAKAGLATATMAVGNNTNGVVNEAAAAGDFWSECAITQKTGANTFVRFTYTTAVNPIIATLTIFASYVPLGSGLLVAV
jgi:hypothetical protein